VVVLNPQTGAVLAMASAPTFNPSGLAFDAASEDRAAENARVAEYWRQLNADDAGQPLINRPTQGRYPPGSTYKAVTAVGTLEHQAEARPDEIACPNERPVVNAVNDLEGVIRRVGEPNLERVFAFSCNTAFAEYALRLGRDLMVETAARFDIVTPDKADERYSGFRDLATEVSTLVAQPGFLNREPALADTGYGQGQLQVTPLQMALVAAAIANDGVMPTPYLVDRITRPDGSLVIRQVPSTIRRSMSAATAATMRRNMRAVVEYGFGQAAQGVSPAVALVGGKSGTAEHGVGLPTHAWYIAFAPLEQPRYAVAVMIENGGEGSSTGAAAAGQVLAAAFALEN
jgi:penicillin-binding protein A